MTPLGGSHALDAASLEAWNEHLEELTFYALLGVPTEADADRLKQAFHTFAHHFHPDGHGSREPGERATITRIFKRGNEAYRVLSDPASRGRYDAWLASGASPSEAARRAHTNPPRRTTEAPPRLEDSIRSPSARAFARRAEELVKKGDLRQAKLQLMLARHREPENDALLAYLQEIEAREKGA